MPQAKPTNLVLRRKQGAPSVLLCANRTGRLDDVSGCRLVVPAHSGSIASGVGPLGQSLAFDGSTTSVSLGTPTFLQPSASSDWSLTFWFRAVNVASVQMLYACNTVRVFLGAGALNLDDLRNSGAQVAVSANTWYFAAVTWLAASFKYTISVNARPPASVTEPVAYGPSGSTTVGSTAFTGLLDFVSVFTRQLSHADISREYATPFWRFGFVDDDADIGAIFTDWSVAASSTLNLSSAASEVRDIPVAASPQLSFSASASQATKEYGRFRRGDYVPLQFNLPGIPDSPPVLSVTCDGDPVDLRLFPMAADDMTVFGQPYFLGGQIATLGTFLVTCSYTIGGVAGYQSATFEVVDGGDSAGSILAMDFYARPEGNYVVAKSSGGRLFQGRNPYL